MPAGMPVCSCACVFVRLRLFAVLTPVCSYVCVLCACAYSTFCIAIGVCSLVCTLRRADTEPWSKWLHVARSSWVQMQLVRPAVVAAYAMCSANDVPERDPATWRLRGKVRVAPSAADPLTALLCID